MSRPKSELPSLILAALENREPISNRQIAALTNTSPVTAQHHLIKLLKAGKVIRKRSYNGPVWYYQYALVKP